VTAKAKVEMELNISASVLRDALKKLARVFTGRTTMVVLSGVLLEASDNVLTLRGTNLSSGITLRCTANVLAPGKTVLPFKQLYDYVVVLGDCMINIMTSERTAIVSEYGGKAKTKFNVFDADEFPSLPEMGNVLFDVPAQEFLTNMARVEPAIAKDDTRPVLSCMLIEPTTEKVRLVAADGFRLHIVELSVGTTGSPKMLLSGDAISLFGPLFSHEGNIAIHVSKNTANVDVVSNVIFVQDETELAVRCNEGTFPNYTPLIPTKSERSFTCDANAFCKAINKVTVVSKHDGFNPLHLTLPATGVEETVGLHLAIKGGGITVEAENDIDVETTPGEKITFGVRAEYFTDTIDFMPKDALVRVSLTSPGSPIKIEPIDQGKVPFIGIVMPMTISQSQ
jgi:DNA polymerase III subunit beta